MNVHYYLVVVTVLPFLSSAESTENREKKRRRRSRWGSDAPQPSPSTGPTMPVPGPASLPGQSPMGFTPGGMNACPPPGTPVGIRPPGVAMNPQLGVGAMPRPNMPGAGSKRLSVFSCYAPVSMLYKVCLNESRLQAAAVNFVTEIMLHICSLAVQELQA